MKLTPQQADKLNKAWKAVYDAYNALEDLRPAGGFRLYIDREKYCSCCGIEFRRLELIEKELRNLKTREEIKQ